MRESKQLRAIAKVATVWRSEKQEPQCVVKLDC